MLLYIVVCRNIRPTDSKALLCNNIKFYYNFFTYFHKFLDGSLRASGDNGPAVKNSGASRFGFSSST